MEDVLVVAPHCVLGVNRQETSHSSMRDLSPHGRLDISSVFNMQAPVASWEYDQADPAALAKLGHTTGHMDF